MRDLSGCVVVVTGAARGIGAAIAQRYASEGAKLVLVDIEQESLNKTADAIKEKGVEVLSVNLDLTKPGAAKSLVAESVEKFSRIDVLVNNAGVIRVKPFLDTTEEDWDYIHDINARALFFVMQATAKQMLQQSPRSNGRPLGKIINMASVAGRTGRKFMGAYSASKAAVIMTTQTAASELAPRVTVNSICPGPVDTDMWIKIDKEWAAIEGRPVGSVWKDRANAVPMGRGEQPTDVAAMASFLASEDSDFITGQSYHVDGGVLML